MKARDHVGRKLPSDVAEARLEAKSTLIGSAHVRHETKTDAQDSQEGEGSGRAGSDIAQRAGREGRDERNRGGAPSGHGSVVGCQVATPVP